jgi:ABC-type lipoprotein release transport system permease subunit
MEVSWELNPLPAAARAENAASQVMQLPISVSWILSATAFCFTLMLGAVAAWAMSKSTARLRPSLVLNRG